MSSAYLANPIDFREHEKQEAWLAVSYSKHKQPGAYAATFCNGIELVSDEDSRTCARFDLATPEVQDPETHWPGNFFGKAEIKAHFGPHGLQGFAPAPLLQILRTAIGDRRSVVTQYAWYVVKRYGGKPPLGLADLRMSTELVHFLLFSAQVPDLFCAIAHEREKTKGGQWFAGMDSNVRKEDEGEIVPMVAALMDAVHYVKRTGGEGEEAAPFCDDVEAHKKAREGWAGHGYAPSNGWWRSEVGSPPGYGHDTWWHRALTLLIQALPRQPNTVCRFQGEAMRPITTSLLERAVLCSELSTVAFELLVSNCEFCHRDVSCALHGVLYRGNVRGPTALRLASVLYSLLWHARSMPVHDPPLSTWSTWHIERVWEDLLIRATCEVVVPLHSTKAKRVTIPFDYCKGDAKYGVEQGIYDTAYYEEMAEQFFAAHCADMSRNGDREALIKICCHAMRVAVQVGAEMTYLVKVLVQNAAALGFLDRYFGVNAFLQQILMHHTECWHDWVASEYMQLARGDTAQKELWDKVTCEAMTFLAGNRVRHAVDALIDAIIYLPPGLMTSVALKRLVQCLCCPKTRSDELYSRHATEDHVRACWATLDMYLTTGGPKKWDPQVLLDGLKAASHYRSGVAAEVFLSAPYNVEPPKDDHFLLAIVGALLAPGEKAALAPKEQFDKRMASFGGGGAVEE